MVAMVIVEFDFPTDALISRMMILLINSSIVIMTIVTIAWFTVTVVVAFLTHVNIADWCIDMKLLSRRGHSDICRGRRVCRRARSAGDRPDAR